MKSSAAKWLVLTRALTVSAVPLAALLSLNFFFSTASASDCRRVFDSTSLRRELPDAPNQSIDRSRARAVLFETLGRGGNDFSKADQMAELINKSPNSIRQVWIEELLAIHRKMEKQPSRDQETFKVSPRRLTDRTLSLTVRGDLMISKLIAQGKNPIEAYGEYLRLMTKGLNKTYGTSEVMAILQLVQNSLRSLPHPGGGDHLIVGGSFVNGRADLFRSDLDINSWHAEWAKSFETEKFQPLTSKALASVGAQGKLTVGFTRMADNFFGLLAPVVIKVTREQIELQLFAPPKMETRRMYGLDDYNHQPTETHVLIRR